MCVVYIFLWLFEFPFIFTHSSLLFSFTSVNIGNDDIDGVD